LVRFVTLDGEDPATKGFGKESEGNKLKLKIRIKMIIEYLNEYFGEN